MQYLKAEEGETVGGPIGGYITMVRGDNTIGTDAALIGCVSPRAVLHQGCHALICHMAMIIRYL